MWLMIPNKQSRSKDNILLVEARARPRHTKTDRHHILPSSSSSSFIINIRRRERERDLLLTIILYILYLWYLVRFQLSFKEEIILKGVNFHLMVRVLLTSHPMFSHSISGLSLIFPASVLLMSETEVVQWSHSTQLSTLATWYLAS